MTSTNDLERLHSMLVSDGDLRKLDDARLKALSHEQLLELSMQLSRDLKEARDRLNQNPNNSSRPPSAQAPWAGLGLPAGETDTRQVSNPSEDDPAEDTEDTPASRGGPGGRSTGRGVARRWPSACR